MPRPTLILPGNPEYNYEARVTGFICLGWIHNLWPHTPYIHDVELQNPANSDIFIMIESGFNDKKISGGVIWIESYITKDCKKFWSVVKGGPPGPDHIETGIGIWQTEIKAAKKAVAEWGGTL